MANIGGAERLRGEYVGVDLWVRLCLFQGGHWNYRRGLDSWPPYHFTGFPSAQEEGNVQLVTDSCSGEYYARSGSIVQTAPKWTADPEFQGTIAQNCAV